MYSSQLLKGTFEIIILKILTDHSELYGYDMIQKVSGLSGGEINLPYGSLYPILHKMEEAGWLSSREEQIGRRKRLYYKLTEKGSEIAQSKVEEFMRFARTMITVLRPA